MPAPADAYAIPKWEAEQGLHRIAADTGPEVVILRPKLCRHYDAHCAGQCREMAAERVADKTSANDCGWFVPRPEAYKGGGPLMAQASRGALDALCTSARQRRTRQARGSRLDRRAVQEIAFMGAFLRRPQKFGLSDRVCCFSNPHRLELADRLN